MRGRIRPAALGGIEVISFMNYTIYGIYRLPIEFYPDGNRGPVQAYFEQLRLRGERRKALARLLADLDVLSIEGVIRPRISLAFFGPGLWELRRQFQGVHYRVLFCVHQRAAWLLHAFEKETRRTPQRDLNLARSRMARLAGGG